MWQRAYLHKLQSDLELWIERGWVTPANAEQILKSAEERPSTRRMPAILAVLGAVLIGFAVMSFVAANWYEIPKLAKLIAIFVAMSAAWLAAIPLERRGHPAFAQAAILIGLGLFGGGIMLIAQIYHIRTDDPGGVLAWCIAALAAAWALPSRPALALGILLSVFWTVFAVQLDEGSPHWAFWIVWLAGAALALRLAWLPGFHLSLLSLILWQAINVDAISNTFAIAPEHIAVFLILEALAIWLAAILFSSRAPRFASAAEAYAIVATFVIFWILQLDPGGTTPEESAALWSLIVLVPVIVVGALAFLCLTRGRIDARHGSAIVSIAVFSLLWLPLQNAAPALIPWLYAALFLALAAWLVSYGTARDSRFAVNFGFVAFGAEVLWLYFETLNTLLDTALFFALGGILLIVGALFMERMRRRLVKLADGGAS
ncbi:DUF2157 domain-containing protein [Parvibaculum sp.]|uniref:DUF2157 domain-containing protein n=1 Tax=Parvibaculum sp. TaxID=2024848 RepID=UPI001B207EB2|nr:DUF2157 domain-containing protein [Parvibaculum sp.]MBO6633526.1 DUF2157 domain-containing protein [Parvibaculum sp.]MBO6679998.1 DUF2157 domain-containing protein [Parvibaculum sp.]MBO6683559.1 DUF2157 domain-containing protein [Parvibaculum sp.]MBO6906451.1 DUF2157 domain-containing protein [Parvibaculum sp.]